MKVLLFLICLAQTDRFGELSLSSHWSAHLERVAEGRLHDLFVLEVAVLEDLRVARLREDHVDAEVQKADFLLVVQNKVLRLRRVPHRLARLGRPAEQVLVHLPHLLVEGLELGLGHVELLQDWSGYTRFPTPAAPASSSACPADCPKCPSSCPGQPTKSDIESAPLRRFPRSSCRPGHPTLVRLVAPRLVLEHVFAHRLALRARAAQALLDVEALVSAPCGSRCRSSGC